METNGCRVPADRHVNLLVALLVKYPEISTVHVTTSRSALELSFLLQGATDESLIPTLEKRLQTSLGALSLLDGVKQRHIAVTFHVYDSLSRLVVSRTLSDLASEEFSIILEIVKETCGDLLIVDGGHADYFLDLFEGEDAIDATLEALRSKAPQQELIGIRDGGRVLVFNEAKLESPPR